MAPDPAKASDLMVANDVTTLASVLRSAFHPKAGDGTFWAEADKSPRKNKLADVSNDDGDSDFLSPAGFLSD